MTNNVPTTAEHIATALRIPFVPDVIADLAHCENILEILWPQLAPSVETIGFVNSALYMADMALEAVEEVYEPTITPAALLNNALDENSIHQLLAVLDVFQWIQPQLLLLCAALAEARGNTSVGGQGHPQPRHTVEREQDHLMTKVEFASSNIGALPAITERLQLSKPSELYRAVGFWPAYLEVAWEEIQHLAAYPLFRQRGRGLYYYARSSSRFLAQPLYADDAALRKAGITDNAIAQTDILIDAALPTLATMMMHCSAMRLGLGVHKREVVTQSAINANQEPHK